MISPDKWDCSDKYGEIVDKKDDCGLMSLGICGWLSLAFLGAAITVGLALAYPAVWTFLKNVKWLDVLTAFGTCGAVLAAVGLHREKRKATWSEKEESARFYALESRVKIQYFVNLATRLKDLNFARVSQPLSSERINELAWFSEQILGFEEVLKLDLERLSPLEHGIAARLAVGISQVVQGAMAVNAFTKIDGVLELNTETQRQDAISSHLWLSGGHGILKEAFERLSLVADTYFKNAVKRTCSD